MISVPRRQDTSRVAVFTVLVSDIRIRGSTTRDIVLAKYGVAL